VRNAGVIQLPLKEHAILFMLPALLIAMHAGLLKFKDYHLRSDITLPVYHAHESCGLTDYGVAIVYADHNGGIAY